MGEKTTWNSTWHVWVMLGMIVGNFLRQLLELGLKKFVAENLGFTLRACVLQNIFGYSPWTYLGSSPNFGYHGHLRAMAHRGGGHWKKIRKPCVRKYRVDFIQDT
jgi:hypothetical protein